MVRGGLGPHSEKLLAPLKDKEAVQVAVSQKRALIESPLVSGILCAVLHYQVVMRDEVLELIIVFLCVTSYVIDQV